MGGCGRADDPGQLIAAARALREVQFVPGGFIGTQRALRIHGENFRFRDTVRPRLPKTRACAATDRRKPSVDFDLATP